ncbi:MAG: glycosyltransferase N-terminal domain-containing protein, partial [Flavitalea sp.]
MFLLIYNTVIRLYAFGVRIASFWNPKAKLWINGRNDILKHIRQTFNSNGKPVVWMHSSSLGEFEQGRFLLENIKLKYPGTCIVITFFSPSGYQVSKNYKGADYVYYLPLSTKQNARKFIGIIQPNLVLWIKYDYWYHYLV